MLVPPVYFLGITSWRLHGVELHPPGTPWCRGMQQCCLVSIFSAENLPSPPRPLIPFPEKKGFFYQTPHGEACCTQPGAEKAAGAFSHPKPTSAPAASHLSGCPTPQPVAGTRQGALL